MLLSFFTKSETYASASTFFLKETRLFDAFKYSFQPLILNEEINKAMVPIKRNIPNP
jgi:hypothetical protein